jgi:hypothetical protein
LRLGAELASTQASSAVTFDLDSLYALRFSRPRDMVSVQRFAQRFDYSIEELESLCHVRPGQIGENPFNARVQQFMRHALDVVAQRMLAVPDLDRAIAWFRNEPLAAHGDRTPEGIVADGDQRVLLKSQAPRHN